MQARAFVALVLCIAITTQTLAGQTGAPSPIERKNRTLAQIAKRRVHPTGNAAVAEGRAAAGGELRRALQRCPLEQRGWLITPKDMLAGRQQEIHAERDWKLEEARR